MKIKLTVPKRLSSKEKEILAQFAERHGEVAEPTPIRLKDL